MKIDFPSLAWDPYHVSTVTAATETCHPSNTLMEGGGVGMGGRVGVFNDKFPTISIISHPHVQSQLAGESSTTHDFIVYVR